MVSATNWRRAAFRDRADGGRALAAKLASYARMPGVVVLGLPRGGVPVAYEVAGALEAPLDILVVRKLGVPGHAELAMGAIASGGVRVMNWSLVESLGLGEAAVEEVAGHEGAELARRESAYRGGRPPLTVAGKVAIVVDDGLATAQPCGLPLPRYGRSDRGASWSLFRLELDRRVSNSARRPTRSSASERQSPFKRWASGTETSPRQPTTTSVPY